jgi:hypothetical protein
MMVHSGFIYCVLHSQILWDSEINRKHKVVLLLGLLIVEYGTHIYGVNRNAAYCQTGQQETHS